MPKGFAKLLKDLLRRPDVSPVAKLTYTFLLDAMRNRGVCQYGVRAIAAGIGVYRDRVTKAVGELEAAGLLLVERRVASGHGRGGTRLTTVYRLPDSVLKTGTPERHENRDAQKSIASRKP